MAIIERGKFVSKAELIFRSVLKAFLKTLHHGEFANDTAANTGGVPVGGAYWNTTNNKLHTRMS